MPGVIHFSQAQNYAIGILDRTAPGFQRKRRALTRRGGMFRINHESWWAQELPSEAEYQTALETLRRCGWKVDYVISHCCPTSIQALTGTGRPPDALTDFFEELRQKLAFQLWFFGHYHANQILETKYVLLYEQIISL